jgi:predicted PurR-regulated permease PerM
MNANTPTSRELTHTMLAALFIGLLIASCFWILRPFLVSIIWAAIIVIATWPLFTRLDARLGGRRGLAVAAMTGAMLLLVFVPMLLAVLTIANNAESITAQAKSLTSISLSSPPEWIERAPLVGGKLAEHWKVFAALGPEERFAKVAPYARTMLQWFAAQAGGIGMAMLHFLLTVIIAAILYAQGETVRAGVLSFARRLAGRRGEDAAVLAGKAVRGVVLGVVVTALIQATLGGVGLFITGIPAAGLLTAVMLILCLAQLGPILVLIPAIVWLYWSGQPAWGTVLIVFTVVAATIDNFIRPFLIRKGVELPLLLIFAGVIGGLIAFGIIGLFIGPVVLAVSYTLLEAWVTDTDAESGPSGVPGT